MDTSTGVRRLHMYEPIKEAAKILEAAATEVVDVEAAPDLQSYEAMPIDALWDEINIE